MQARNFKHTRLTCAEHIDSFNVVVLIESLVATFSFCFRSAATLSVVLPFTSTTFLQLQRAREALVLSSSSTATLFSQLQTLCTDPFALPRTFQNANRFSMQPHATSASLAFFAAQQTVFLPAHALTASLVRLPLTAIRSCFYVCRHAHSRSLASSILHANVFLRLPRFSFSGALRSFSSTKQPVVFRLQQLFAALRFLCLCLMDLVYAFENFSLKNPIVPTEYILLDSFIL